MSNSKVAERYARSIMGLAKEHATGQNIVEDMKYIAECVKNKDLVLMLNSPIVHASKKKQIFKALFGGKINPLTMKFLELMTDKGREKTLGEIANAVLDINRKDHGIIQVKVTTAEATTPDINAQISKKLGELLPGKTIEISSIINPAIIGGFILEYNQQEYNASIAYTLDKMRKTFKA